jgi:hypothetical protein
MPALSIDSNKALKLPAKPFSHSLISKIVGLSCTGFVFAINTLLHLHLPL